MPPQFQVLRCYKCSIFQGHQTTKSNKWECKVCGEKQSFKRFYGLGTAKECRCQVQKLNGLRGQLEEMKNNTDENSNSNKTKDIVTEPVKNNYKPVQNSKWSDFVDEPETVEENTNENMSLGETQVSFEIPIKRRKRGSSNFKRNPDLAPKEGNNYNNSATSPKIVPNSLIFSRLIEPKSKPQQPNFNVEDSIPGEEPLNVIKHNNLNKFVPPVCNKNSRWAQFTDEPHETDQTDSILTPQNDNMLFSCSDDADIESILGV